MGVDMGSIHECGFGICIYFGAFYHLTLMFKYYICTKRTKAIAVFLGGTLLGLYELAFSQ